jgi:hypothetical protein
MVAGVSELARAVAAYQNVMKMRQKSEEELKDESIKVKPPLPSGCGNHVDLYV